MSYNQKHILIHDPKTGYNTIADQYGQYHKHLDSFDKGVFVKYLPRQENISLIDLWAGDGRLFKYLSPLKPERYIACDIAEKLLSRHPNNAGKVEKVVCDLEQILPFDDESFDLATSFFVLEHIEDIKWLFHEVYRILKTWWVWIIGHFIQRREFIWKKNKDQFKIDFFNHRIQDLEKFAYDCFFDIHLVPIHEQGNIIGHIIVCKKV